MKCRTWALIVCAGLAVLASPRTGLAVDSFFDVFFDITPTDVDSAGTTVGTLGTLQNGQYQPLGNMLVSMPSAAPNTGLRVTPDTPVPGSTFAVDSFFDIVYDVQLDPTGSDFQVDSFFDVFVELTPDSTMPPPAIRTLGGTFNVDSFFDITYQIDFHDGRIVDLNLNGFLGPGLKLNNFGTNTPQTFTTDSFFDVFVEITVDDPSAVDLGPPLVHFRMDGQGMPEPASVSLLVLGGLALIRRRR